MEVPPLNMSGVLALSALLTNSDEGNLNFLQKNDPSYLRFDWDHAQKWKALIEEKVLVYDLPNICRSVCLEFILSQPVLVELARNGRDAVVANLTPDELQVFRNGHLLDRQPSLEVVKWWDVLRLLAKRNLDTKLLEQGRLAEMWTMEEESRIVKEFTRELPELVSLGSDKFGFDILSFRMTPEGIIKRIQIEVKSYTSKYYPHFYLTANEWIKASQIASSYLLYLWCIETKEFRILTFSELEIHIPSNNGMGKWQDVLVEKLR